jgi:Uma2 family endonuclease
MNSTNVSGGLFIYLELKLNNYLLAGTIVWVVNPVKQTVEVYEPGQPSRVLRSGETLEGGQLLPGFKLAVKAIFQ